MSEPIEQARRAEPAWDEVRERRVLTRVHQANDALRAGRLRTRRGAMGAALAAVVLLGAFVTGRALWGGDAGSVVAGAATDPDPAAGHLSLSDGSEIELTEGARVEVVLDAPEEVRLLQHAGSARYVVSHRAERRFVVGCEGVEVEVRGTRFWVHRRAGEPAEAATVEVDVEEGRVEVRRGAERSLLSGGESLRVLGPIVEPAAAEPVPSEHALEAGGEVSGRSAIDPDPASVARPETPERPRGAPHPTSRPETELDVATLLTQAEEARRAGRLDDAVRALNQVLAQLGDDPRAATAYFTLGRVERGRHRHAAAAAAFEAAHQRDPDAVLAEDALAEATVSWSVAGRLERARSTGARYLARYPTGQYVERVRAALGD